MVASGKQNIFVCLIDFFSHFIHIVVHSLFLRIRAYFLKNKIL